MYDTCRSNSYEVFLVKFDKYYWQKNDSILRRRLVDKYLGENDSLLFEKPADYKDLHGVEFAFKPKEAHNFSRKRLIILGDTLLEISTNQQIESLHDRDIEDFFSAFKYNRSVPASNIFHSKAGLLISDLSSNDSTVRAAAGSALKNAPFESTDIPALCGGLLKISDHTEADYEKYQIGLTNQIVKLNDSFSLSFARKYYPIIKNGSVKDDLLFIMCARQTKNNFDSIAQFMVKYPLPGAPSDDLLKRFKTSDTVSSIMYPTLLLLLRDTNGAASVINLFNSLLDSNKVSIRVLKDHEQDILDYGIHRLQIKQKDSDSYSQGDAPLISTLGKLNTAKGNALLKQWLSLHGNQYLIYKSIQALLINHQEIDQSAIFRLAKDRDYRTSIYDLLKKYNQYSLFPLTYRTQYYFAESLAYSSASDDNNPSEFVYLGQRKMQFKGKYYRFFFYKFSYSDSGDKKIACAGPFNLDPASMSRDIASYDTYEGIYSESEKNEEQEQKLVDQMEAWYHF
jgi:hypothetical protein